LTELRKKIEQLDESIRGNGKPGLLVRLDRLEQIEAGRKRLTWAVAGAFISAGASAVMQFVQWIGRQ
jgi:hypothetical protein